jgi:hypothetical protein
MVHEQKSVKAQLTETEFRIIIKHSKGNPTLNGIDSHCELS